MLFITEEEQRGRLARKYGLHVEGNAHIVDALCSVELAQLTPLNATIIILLLGEVIQGLVTRLVVVVHVIENGGRTGLVAGGSPHCQDVDMNFPKNLGAIACVCVIEGRSPVNFVSHAGGDWQFYCSDRNHNFEDSFVINNDLKLVHVAHLLAMDPSLGELSDLPENMGAERSRPGQSWIYFDDFD